MNKTGEKQEEKKETRRRGRPSLAEQATRQRVGSVGSLSDFKRKREEVEEAERIRAEEEFIKYFQKVRKVGRSPPQKKIEGERMEEVQEIESKQAHEKINMDKIDNLTEIILTIKKDTEEIMKENKAINLELKDLKEEWKRRQEEWAAEKKEIETKIKELERKKDQSDELMERIKLLERKEELRERRERRNNIILRGDDLPRGESPKQSAEQVIRQTLQVDAEIEEAFWTRAGKRGSLLVAKIKNWQQKKEVMLKKNKLKGKKLYIDNDLTKKERELQKTLYEIARAEREQGAQVKIGYRKLKINDKIFKWKEDSGLREANFWSRQSSVTLETSEGMRS